MKTFYLFAASLFLLWLSLVVEVIAGQLGNEKLMNYAFISGAPFAATALISIILAKLPPKKSKQ